MEVKKELYGIHSFNGYINKHNLLIFGLNFEMHSRKLVQMFVLYIP